MIRPILGVHFSVNGWGREGMAARAAVGGPAGSELLSRFCLHSFMKSTWLILLLLCGLVLTGCQTTSPTAMFPAKSPAADILAAGDVLRITFVGSPDLNQAQKIRADGRIALPLVGEWTVAGKRLGEVQSELRGVYAKKLQNSEILVSLDAVSMPVYVSGAVGAPGEILLDRPLTALEAVIKAGGFTRGLADKKKVKLMRRVEGVYQTQILNLEDSRAQATYLQRYDVIEVPETFL